MKKLRLYLMIMVLSLSFFPTTSFAAENNSNSLAANTKNVPVEVNVMLNRLDEIKAMDKSSMSSSEKRELRKEVKGIKKELKATGKGVYLSVGAIIVIVLLLILLV